MHLDRGGFAVSLLLFVSSGSEGSPAGLNQEIGGLLYLPLENTDDLAAGSWCTCSLDRSLYSLSWEAWILPIHRHQIWSSVCLFNLTKLSRGWV
ncbi:uncharacterized protein J3D65DRAFT_608966 [Phyllosticta citribraziliensis]|uniref:Secreted protein n=1 Tax=Phyllosticta citribraziliensis TaxID=989973 RepID=A0ABR1MAC8_9PEZI